jgi:hypothetical protein
MSPKVLEDQINVDDTWYCYRCDWFGVENKLTLHGTGSNMWYTCPECSSPQVDYIPPVRKSA